MTDDYTALDIEHDPEQRLLSGVTAHGNIEFEVPYMTQVSMYPNLYVGGCTTGLILPSFIDHVISLYPWEEYDRCAMTYRSHAEFVMYDDVDFDPDDFIRIAAYALDKIESGPTLIHCQAGLNRSCFVAAMCLIMKGFDPDEVVGNLRKDRGQAVLCNPAFEDYVLNRTADLLNIAPDSPS